MAYSKIAPLIDKRYCDDFVNCPECPECIPERCGFINMEKFDANTTLLSFVYGRSVTHVQQYLDDVNDTPVEIVPGNGVYHMDYDDLLGVSNFAVTFYTCEGEGESLVCGPAVCSTSIIPHVVSSVSGVGTYIFNDPCIPSRGDLVVVSTTNLNYTTTYSRGAWEFEFTKPLPLIPGEILMYILCNGVLSQIIKHTRT